MAKLFNRIIKSFTLKNAPSGGKSSGAGSFNRDPKAMQVKRVGYQLTESGGGGGRDNFEGPQADFNIIDTAIKRDSYIMQSMMKYSELIFKSGWHFQGKNEQALLYLKLRLETMAVATLIPTEELFQGIADDIVRYANSFIVKARAKGGQGLPPGLAALPVPPSKDPIGGYFRLPPSTVTIARDKNGTVTKYKQEVQGADKPIEFRPEDVIHIAVNRPAGRPFGDPWIAPVLEDVRLLRKVEENAGLLLYRHIFPLLAYTVGTDQPGRQATDTELTELQSVIENLPTDGAILLPERHKVEAIDISTIDGRPYLDYFEQRVFTGLGMSQVDMGRGDTANRNTADAMSGIKADRVKGWQKALQTQIDKYMIDEILIEGGFDPLVNPDFDINFVFDEIEQEKKIAKENHALLMWNSNIATWEETRIECGREPVADESRLAFQMIGATTTDAEVDNKNAPENQNGKRTAPKKKTEALEESVFNHIPMERYDSLNESLQSHYRILESDVIGAIESLLSKEQFPLHDNKQWAAPIHFSKEKMLHVIQQSTQYALSEGVQKTKKDMGRKSTPKVNYSRSLRVMREYASESIDRLEESLKASISLKLESCNTNEDAYLAVKGVFQSLKHRLSLMSKVMIAKSYNYGYILALMKCGESHAKSLYEGDCLICQENSQESINLEQYASLDEIAIFYRIPPWHPNCACEITHIGGGE
ncbi:hypothetical protein [Bacillus thuringiensis]|uniref:hypothetical protein n=1 Tax=Bacillus thuringiensis TaxID=1428 RepID=UPI000BF60A76|nr:hypothetical protein [Bacillus thuringiensis]PES55899.1 hypothetical protein CN499_05605 [Bacillus thuringiensis]